jgi:SSS family solute:Na+ symporter
MMTLPPSEEKIAGLTYASISAEGKKEIRESWNRWDVINTIGVLALVLGMYLYFSFWLK